MGWLLNIQRFLAVRYGRLARSIARRHPRELCARAPLAAQARR